MPIYTYRCSLCGISDDYIKEIKDRDNKFLCEQDDCSGVMIRELAAPSFQLKGDGWYKDGYTKKPKKEEKNENS